MTTPSGAPRPFAAVGSARPTWRPGLAAASVAVAAILLAFVGLLAARPDVALLGAPMLLTVAYALARPRGVPAVRLREQHVRAEAGRFTGALEIDDGGASTVRLRVSTPGFRSVEALLAADARAEVAVVSARTGPQEFFRTDWIAEGVDAAFVTEPRLVPAVRVTVEPAMHALGQQPLPFRLLGLTGAHTGRRPGDGDDLHDIAPFAPGDRLRRIDWRVTARRGTQSGAATELYVRRTRARADAVVMLVVDSRDDVGADVVTWAGGIPVPRDEPTSLDIAREAAASIGRAFLAGGDRVGLEDLSVRRRGVRPGSGRAHLDRITYRLALSRPEGDPSRRLRPPQVPSGALVVLVSTFLDAQSARMARLWRASGHRVVAVDVLPATRTDRLDDAELTAYRLVALARSTALERLVREGVELVSWTGPGGPVAASVALAALRRARPAEARR
ncbi:protein of unknown function DUF58 [Beutenbergia cavernae DSM 12333]|uniref:DUF58 domain-containing protein n=1 Tax=Beutenbergia cavernae (strain ATCC BAA-8 / DSM 12333 / CCUG 43141 / JCM 11478 / NBRC 16432 / NCIMB 13614 / HKI 0122) TaxID=471853 RepID=C5BZ01_BEUC1|nr:DUF58 domain-containing protein [Beutenbergia cavernae]ACQ81116.1 protein of unknown function DUF58 [Beutenbergia cavernae DSM 12333]